ncbi:phospholipase A and acyltransferase 2-like [Scomber scombrus]|uniref:phospholipase A and acyltransferase 2-like n=1 Tax=Scomber scombrus TaxID=13677 RepID=UPI002DDA7EEA|nr:phospholipase A and acyltransferase 2-like [Scomber scombrus]
MAVYCPYCRNELAGHVGRLCNSCHGDIGFLAPVLYGRGTVSGDMTEAALFHQYFAERHRTEDAAQLELGDLIEIFRDGYQHWAVYVGDGYIVELVAIGTGSVGVSSTISGTLVRGQVRKEKLQVVVEKDKWEKNNTKHLSSDNKLRPRQKHEIVKEALSRVGMTEYSVSKWNCEHFATLCRYGKAVSLQVMKAVNTVAAAGISGFLGSLASGTMFSAVPGSYSS